MADQKTKPQTSPVPVRHDVSLLTDDDLYLFNEGNHYRLYHKLGAHVLKEPEAAGTYFAVWAPDAAQVWVTGDFNGWDKGSHPLAAAGPVRHLGGVHPRLGAGLPVQVPRGLQVRRLPGGQGRPLRLFLRRPAPHRLHRLGPGLRLGRRRTGWPGATGPMPWTAPMSVYEVHLGSWRRVPEEGDRFLTYRELAPLLAEHVQRLGFTHVEFMPVMEHPFYGSWGYQTTGYFAPTSRYGTPQDFMFLVDYLHRHGIGVILDWVPSHFPADEHGPGFFDGTHLYEHADPRRGFHPDWKSAIFNYGRNEVRCFLMSSALFWLDRYHADGLRVDAVASMLYLDYSREEGEWLPNQYGGREDLEAIAFLRQFNTEVYKSFPDVQTAAEESTDWPMVSRPIYVGGLGFGLKWDMGWMHDTLKYLAVDPVFRRYHHNTLTFRMLYAFQENFLLPLSHDEVVYGKGSLLTKMPGDDWQKFANLRLLLGYMYGQPGKKLLFMGGEFGQWSEWYHEASLDWHLLDEPRHAALQRWVEDLNRVYRQEAALFTQDFTPAGFPVDRLQRRDAERHHLPPERAGRGS